MRISHTLFLAALVLPGPSIAIGDTAGSATLSVTSAETITPVVELYTSEGCSSCPRADDYLTELGTQIGDDFRAVPLAFHVDYWNWLGWEDPFSSEEFTERQRMVAHYNNQQSIYTPELVVAGKEARGGRGIVDTIQSSNETLAGISIRVDLTSSGGRQFDASIMFDNMASDTNAEAYIALYENGIVREIRGGENEGRTLTHNFVVRHWSDPIRVREGKSSEMLTLVLEDNWNSLNVGFAVIVVDTANGETLQSVRASLGSMFPS